MTTYPDTYLHIEECRSGETYIKPLGDDDVLDLETQLDLWIESEFSGELERDGDIMPRLQGDYYAQIMTDGRAPDSPICWQSGGFYLKSTYE